MRRCYLLFVLVIGLAGCANQQSKPYTLPNNPLSILVLPPVNKSVEVNASNKIMAHISEPLAERGFYVFPVAVIERFMRENGMHTADQMHQIPLEKFQEHIAPDAILYITINQWGQKFQVIQSVSIVDATLVLVDAKTGATLWQQRAYKTYTPNSGGNNGLAGVILGAVVDQVVGSLVDHTDQLASDVLVAATNRLPEGPRLIESHQQRQLSK